jgi:hypothetical protein
MIWVSFLAVGKSGETRMRTLLLFCLSAAARKRGAKNRLQRNIIIILTDD